MLRQLYDRSPVFVQNLMTSVYGYQLHRLRYGGCFRRVLDEIERSQWLSPGEISERRTGMLPFVFEDGMGYERYVEYALDVPMYFVYRAGRYIDVAGSSFRDFLAGKLRGFEGAYPTVDDWSDHLTTLFPEVRLKRFLEMRGADGGRWNMITALSAFWTGLLYDDAALEAAWQLVKDWSDEEREALRNGVPKSGLRTVPSLTPNQRSLSA